MPRFLAFGGRRLPAQFPRTTQRQLFNQVPARAKSSLRNRHNSGTGVGFSAFHALGSLNKAGHVPGVAQKIYGAYPGLSWGHRELYGSVYTADHASDAKARSQLMPMNVVFNKARPAADLASAVQMTRRCVP